MELGLTTFAEQRTRRLTGIANNPKGAPLRAKIMLAMLTALAGAVLLVTGQSAHAKLAPAPWKCRLRLQRLG
jgi:hypothetical protein